jgi:hypothetical protein
MVEGLGLIGPFRTFVLGGLCLRETPLVIRSVKVR